MDYLQVSAEEMSVVTVAVSYCRGGAAEVVMRMVTWSQRACSLPFPLLGSGYEAGPELTATSRQVSWW